MAKRQEKQVARFSEPAEVREAVFSLLGILEGLAADGAADSDELPALRRWLKRYSPLRDRHPFSETVPLLETCLADGRLDDHEQRDLVWLCRRITGDDSLLSAAAGDMARLRGMLRGIMADGRITAGELHSLRRWMSARDHLRRCWPYDEIESLVFAVLGDGVVDQKEQAELAKFFDQFSAAEDDSQADRLADSDSTTLAGICALAPDIELSNRTFCFAGQFERYTLEELLEIVTSGGGARALEVSDDVDYLIVGSDGNPCWTYACYGRRVDHAMHLRRAGAKLLIVHEYDFCDAIEVGL